MHYLLYNLPYQHDMYVNFMTEWLKSFNRYDRLDIWFATTLAIELMAMEILIND